jgi:hypothetical protein
VLCLSSFSVAQEGKSIDQCAEKKDVQSIATCREQAGQSIHIVKGNLVRLEFNYLTVLRSDGKEVKMHIDETTEMIGYILPGQHVEAKVNQHEHALLIRLIDSP